LVAKWIIWTAATGVKRGGRAADGWPEAPLRLYQEAIADRESTDLVYRET